MKWAFLEAVSRRVASTPKQVLDASSQGQRIFKQRNVDIDVVTLKQAWEWGFSGLMVRGSGAVS
jgi:NADH:ubiquinone oxidoreductase subunit D